MRKYKKGEYRDQFIIAYITDLNDYSDTVQWGIKFCNLLNKGLILLYVCDKEYTDITSEKASVILKDINDKLDLPYIHSFAVLKGKTKDIINNLGDLLNGVIIVSKFYSHHSDINSKKISPVSSKNIFKTFKNSRLAYFIFKHYNDVPFDNVMLSMNSLKECKEKILWTSYFGRFANSVIHICYHRYFDEYLQKQLNLNIGFARKFFGKFNIKTKNVHFTDKFTDIDIQTVKYANQISGNICIFQTTKNRSFIDIITGTQEKRVLQYMDKAPLLFINPREDLFVLCE